MARTKQKVLDDRREQHGGGSSSGLEPRPAEAPKNDPEDDDGEEGEEEEEFEVERIVAQRYIRKRLQYEVKWKNESETTWEPAANLMDTEALDAWTKVASTRMGGCRGERLRVCM